MYLLDDHIISYQPDAPLPPSPPLNRKHKGGISYFDQDGALRGPSYLFLSQSQHPITPFHIYVCSTLGHQIRIYTKVSTYI